MYQVNVALEDLNNQNKAHILLCDYLLREAITKMSDNTQHWLDAKKDSIFLYLIHGNDCKWRISLFPIELGANPSLYKYRAITELSVGDLMILMSSENMRHELLKKLLPQNNHSTMINYFDFKKEYTRYFN